ncbi:Threonine/homoserine/homoserine lactone efflux protein [Desulfotomaculum arcticum]|uniref:Threonine/homoserine/homoserine lactone efflux protein n=1 Tax=Desulfotruncus arcticus DSM 17038 TaxID=1121424 RepID=A0A1I2WU55_9FIRM|nr:Threonine/homoserine/homoserine lactone efflux protein [Desulfotomaculum arcticum] [Desulfotruncus arcticus DSM 17038]
MGAIFTTAFLVGFSGAMMPGPLLTVTIGETTRRGFIAGPLLVLGHAVLEILLVTLLVLGLASYLAADWIHAVIALVGGIFLIYLGWTMYRDAVKGKISLQLDKETAGSAGMHPVLAGILISLSNPYWSLWWATVGLAYITTSMALGTAGLAAFLSGHLLADLVWYGAVSAAVDGGRRFMNQSVYRGIIITCGLFLIGLGGYFAYHGFNKFL